MLNMFLKKSETTTKTLLNHLLSPKHNQKFYKIINIIRKCGISEGILQLTQSKLPLMGQFSVLPHLIFHTLLNQIVIMILTAKHNGGYI